MADERGNPALEYLKIGSEKKAQMAGLGERPLASCQATEDGTLVPFWGLGRMRAWVGLQNL